MSFFSEQKEKYSVFGIYESTIKLTDSDRETMNRLNIKLLEPIHAFSISAPVQTIKAIFQLNAVIKENKIDLVHILFATPHALWGNFISIPYIITTRGSDVLIALPKLFSGNGLKRIKSLLFKRMFCVSFKGASQITSTSQEQLDKIFLLFRVKKGVVLRTGVDVERIAEVESYVEVEKLIGKKGFIFFPRYINNPIYNPELQIDAIELLPNNFHENYSFVFIKKGLYRSDYLQLVKEKIEKMSAKKRISYHILENLPQEILWQFYKKAAVTVMTPITDGTPNTALEAMAAKCPLIIPDLDYDKQLFDGTCMRLKIYNSVELAELMTIAVENYSNEMIENAFQNVKLYGNRNREMQKLEQLYFKIISDK
jgi:glycosyltransferase involved in cell wall biosynthesis